MPNLETVLILAAVAGSMALFISGRFRIDVVAMSTLAVLLLLGLLSPDQALYGFANQATATVAAMFVLTGGLMRTGSVEWLVRHLDRVAGRGESRVLLVLCGAIAVLSAFIINTGTVAVFIPVAISLARRRRLSPSRLLMPISFASQFGGVCTLIGTSTNLLVNAIAVSYGQQEFGFFEFAPLGLVMSVVGILYLVTVAPRLLPKRKAEIQQLDKYRLAEYLAELRVQQGSPLTGHFWSRSQAGREKEVDLIKVVREGKATARAQRTKIRAGDILLLHGNMQTLLELQGRYGLELASNTSVSDQRLRSHQVRLIEVLIPPRSRLVGRTLTSSNFARRFGGVVLAAQRRGTVRREQLADLTLDEGDALLLECDQETLGRLLRSQDVIVTDELTELYLRKDRALTGLGILTAVVVTAALGWLPIHVAALAGAVAMILGRCLSAEEAYEAINWKVIFLLGGILPLGAALEQTGAAAWLAGVVLEPLADLGPLPMLAVVYLLTAFLTEMMSNNASAVILAPIACSLAGALEVDARPFLVAITFAASTSFATPIGYKTNAMIYAPGGYRFLDYTRVGVPLNLIFWVLAVLLIPLIWPF
ncbi:MAG: SLC13 family permease [Acidobacteriota bacterium]